jgi:hypothetical protein
MFKMFITYRQIRSVIKSNFSNIDIEKNQFGIFIYFENGEQVRISILSGRKQHNDQGIHIHSLENKNELEYHLVDAIETASRDCFANIFIHNPLTETEQAEDDRIKGMHARIKAECDSQHEALNILEASVLPGDIIQVDSKNFILVISKCRFDESSFYYTPCNFDGSITQKEYEQSAANYINNSVMLSKWALNTQIVNCTELKKQTAVHNSQDYTWYLTGDNKIDSYMSQLDARYSLFCDAAKSEDKKQFNKNEDRNFHSENGNFIDLFCNGLVK